MKALSLIFLFVFTFTLSAFEIDEIKFDDKVKLDNKDLVLNGVGIRKATFLKIKVYYGGLYVEQKTNDANAIINSKTPKKIVMNFVHDVDAKKLRNGFSEQFEAANKNHAQFKVQMEKFNSIISDVIKGDKMIIDFTNDGVILNAKGKAFDKISGGDFASALLSIWFINVADEGLKSGLLGK